VRVTPDIVADTHHKIVTGHAASKFGLAPPDALDELDRAASLEHLEPQGLHIHLGSQIDDLSTYLRAVDWLVEFIESNGLGDLPVLDLGGGLAVAHTDSDIEPDITDSVETIAQHLAERLIAHGLPLPELIVEPGRSIADRAGVTLYTVGAIKHTAAGVVYAAVDGGMSDNPRPTLYGARYEAFVADRADVDGDRSYSIAGKHCESGDVLIEGAWLPELHVGDILCIPVTGAYTATMASNYNLLPRPAAVMVADGHATPALRRETMQDLLARDLG
jgi:diaminopimelate decarboxylase